MYSLVLSYIICIMQATGQNKFVCLMSYSYVGIQVHLEFLTLIYYKLFLIF